jgi:hypothetical protein
MKGNEVLNDKEKASFIQVIKKVVLSVYILLDAYAQGRVIEYLLWLKQNKS